MSTDLGALLTPKRYYNTSDQTSLTEQNLGSLERSALALYNKGEFFRAAKMLNNILLSIDEWELPKKEELTQCVIHNLACCYFRKKKFFKAYLHILRNYEIAHQIGDTGRELETVYLIDTIERKFRFLIR